MEHIRIEEYSNEDRSTSSSHTSDIHLGSTDSESSDYVAYFSKFPIIQLFLEKLDGTLEDN